MQLSIPKLRRKVSGRTERAVITLTDADTGQRRDYYCGTFGTAEAERQRDNIVADWIANGRRFMARGPATIAQLAYEYERFRKPVVSHSHGANIHTALAFLVARHGDMRTSEFGSRALSELRAAMLQPDPGWSIDTAAKMTGIIQHCFKWALQQEFVTAEQYTSLANLLPLRTRDGYAVKRTVRPVPVEHIDAVIAVIHQPVRDMIRLQLSTAMRPGELCILRPCDIDRNGDVWVYTPQTHKTSYLGDVRIVLLGRVAQEIVTPWLNGPADAYCFKPSDAPKRYEPSDCYCVSSYRIAIRRCCETLGIPSWHPNRLRHNAATAIARHRDLDGARIILGHSSEHMTRRYAERDIERAKNVIRDLEHSPGEQSMAAP